MAYPGTATPFVQLNLTWPRGNSFSSAASREQSLNVGEGVGKLDFGEGVVTYVRRRAFCTIRPSIFLN